VEIKDAQKLKVGGGNLPFYVRKGVPRVVDDIPPLPTFEVSFDFFSEGNILCLLGFINLRRIIQ
jgi:hypothetical protein